LVYTEEKLSDPSRTLFQQPAYIVNGSPPDSAFDRQPEIVVGGLDRRPLMPDHDPAL